MTWPAWLDSAAFVAACLIVPVVWGWLVNWLFNRWRRSRAPGNERSTRTAAEDESDATFSDYQI
jgi:hypothetical protein